MTTTTTTPAPQAPHGLTLSPLHDGDGLAVIGHPHTTYKHRHDLKQHGARWNATRRQWEARTPHDCDTLRRWLTPQTATATQDRAGIFNPYL